MMRIHKNLKTTKSIGKYLQDLKANDTLKHIRQRVLRNVDQSSKEAEASFKKLEDRIKQEKKTFFYVVIDEGRDFFTTKLHTYYVIIIIHIVSPLRCHEGQLHTPIYETH